MPGGSGGHRQGWCSGGFGDMEGRPQHLPGLLVPAQPLAMEQQPPGPSPAHLLQPQPPCDSDGRTHVPIPD